MKRALITGVTGQDGSYLAELLLKKGYEVHGLQRRSSSPNTKRVDHLCDDKDTPFFLHFGDVTDATSLLRIIKAVQPDEIYNLAAQSHVGVSFETPEYTAQSDALGPLRILEALRILDMTDRVKFYQASTSELFGNAGHVPQKETTPFAPRSPYAAAKLYAYWITKNYRDAYGLFACNGILFNHESPRRGHNFVTRKITRAVAAIHNRVQDVLLLGNLEAKRDWGYAPDYVEAMWRMMQHDTPLDLVIATGATHSVREFVTCAFAHTGVSLVWQGSGINECGINAATGATVVKVDPQFFRPTEVDILCGDATQARELLGWQPTTTFDELVKLMVHADMKDMHKKMHTHTAVYDTAVTLKTL